jgi:hypothetical protein
MITTVNQACKKCLWAFIVGPIIKMIEAVFDLLIPLFMKAIIDLSFGSSRDAISNALGSFISLFKLRHHWWIYYSSNGNHRFLYHYGLPIYRCLCSYKSGNRSKKFPI